MELIKQTSVSGSDASCTDLGGMEGNSSPGLWQVLEGKVGEV